MDVRCEHCKTEYEFDDALVSGRGTTVRCTQCGHQFKVRRPPQPGAAADRWVVTTTRGEQLVYLTLRDLQRAIMAKRVGPRDLLSFADSPPRQLGAIAELAPFFEGRPAGRDDVPRIAGPHAEPSSGSDNAHRDTLRPPPAAPAAPPPVEGPPAISEPGSASVAISPFASTFTAAPPEPPPSAAAAREDARADHGGSNVGLPPPTVPVRRTTGRRDLEGLGFDEQDPFPDVPAAADRLSMGGRRRLVGGWVLATVLLLGVGVVGFVVARPYLAHAPAAPAPTQGLDARALTLLREGEQAIDEGKLELAETTLERARGLAAGDPQVLLAVARVAVARADIAWLRARLLPRDPPGPRQEAERELEAAAAKARKAADDAFTSASRPLGDAAKEREIRQAAGRVRVDALRIAGDRATARADATSLSADRPESAYVLAALDLSEPDPLWPTVLDRLRLAARSEGALGRARSVLVYALARSGDVPGARAELARLSESHPLAGALRAYLDGLGSAPASPDSSPPDAGPVAKGGTEVRGGAGAGPEGDSLASLQAAAKAARRGDTKRARQIYEALVAKNPNDSEALAGLGDVLRAQGDTAGAIGYYKRALAANPSYLPALVGLADAHWASGDRGGAQRMYKDIVDRFPEGTYPAHVKQRAAGGSAAPQGGGGADAPKEHPEDPSADAPAVPAATSPERNPPSPLPPSDE